MKTAGQICPAVMDQLLGFFSSFESHKVYHGFAGGGGVWLFVLGEVFVDELGVAEVAPLELPDVVESLDEFEVE